MPSRRALPALRSIFRLFLASLFLPALPALARGNLEVPSPDSAQSGIGAISGWHCTAKRIEIRIDHFDALLAGSGTYRPDTSDVCGRSDTGFSLLFNWNLLSSAFGHTIVALADGEPFASAQFRVGHFGIEFMTGKVATHRLFNFPDIGEVTVLSWEEEKQNFTISGTDSVNVSGTYHGALSQGHADNPFCGPFPPTGPPVTVKNGSFDVTVKDGRMSFAARFVDGTGCVFSSAPIEPFQSKFSGGYVGATFDGAATACGVGFTSESLRVRVNGERLVAQDRCSSRRLVGAK